MKNPTAPLTSTSSDPATPTKTFADFALDARLLSALEILGFQTPTAIQAAALPPFLEGRDVVARARTGTGKTAAFGLPLLERVKDRRAKGDLGVRALVMTPTRELALQVTEALHGFAQKLGVEIATVYGGSSYAPQLRALRAGVPVIVGTPGRLIDLLDRGDLDLKGVELVVLDEADEMLRMGFIDDVEKLLAATPKTRQVGLFSATMPEPIRRVAAQHLREPVNVQDEGGAPSVAAIQQTYVQVPDRWKGEALMRLLRGEPRGTTLVFARTRAACAEAAEGLSLAGFVVEALHGDMTQSARERVVELLRARRLDVVVATDIAARGIDIDHITHVINFDLPDSVEVYTHRIGRTGRAGRAGNAISLVTPREVRGFRYGLQRIGAVVAEVTLPSDADIVARQRGTLSEELKAALAAPERGLVAAWVDALTKDGWDMTELATATLALVAKDRSLSLAPSPDARLPTWARTAYDVKLANGGPGGGRRDEGREAPRSAYGNAPARGSAPRREERDVPRREDLVDIIIPLGRRAMVRPADIAGALANEMGLKGSEIGRIDIRDAASTVGVPKEFAARLQGANVRIAIRGNEIVLDGAAPGAVPVHAPSVASVASVRPALEAASEAAPPVAAREVSPQTKARHVPTLVTAPVATKAHAPAKHAHAKPAHVPAPAPAPAPAKQAHAKPAHAPAKPAHAKPIAAPPHAPAKAAHVPAKPAADKPGARHATPAAATPSGARKAPTHKPAPKATRRDTPHEPAMRDRTTQTKPVTRSTRIVYVPGPGRGASGANSK